MVDGSSANYKLGTGHAIIWNSYIAFMKFGMLIVMTGIFVDNAINSASISNRSTTCDLKGKGLSFAIGEFSEARVALAALFKVFGRSVWAP